MEKIKIKTAQQATAKSGKNYLMIETEDGRKGASWDMELVGKVGQEVEVEVKESEYQGHKNYTFNLPKPLGKFPQKDWTFEKRRAALECAVAYCKGTPAVDVIGTAEKYFEFLNKK